MWKILRTDLCPPADNPVWKLAELAVNESLKRQAARLDISMSNSSDSPCEGRFVLHAKDGRTEELLPRAKAHFTVALFTTLMVAGSCSFTARRLGHLRLHNDDRDLLAPVDGFWTSEGIGISIVFGSPGGGGE